MAAALAALGDRTEAVNRLSQVAEGAGCFGELFEINEEKVVMRPWFSTATGNYVYALNQVLLQCRDERIFIAPATPKGWKEFSFKLPCYDNLVAAVSVQDRRIVELTLTPGDAQKLYRRTLILPEPLVDQRRITQPAVGSLARQDGLVQLPLQFRGTITVIGPPRSPQDR